MTQVPRRGTDMGQNAFQTGLAGPHGPRTDYGRARFSGQ